MGALVSCGATIIISKLWWDGLQSAEFQLRSQNQNHTVVSTQPELKEDEKKSNFPDPSSFAADPVFLLSRCQCNSLTLSLGAVPKTQATTSLEYNEEEDKQTEGTWWRYSSMRNAAEPKLNQERAQCFPRQSYQVSACHKCVSKFGSNHYAEIFDNAEIFCSHQAAGDIRNLEL